MVAPKRSTTSRPRAKDIGIDVRSPRASCTDPHCPFHGQLSVRGQILEGTVVSIAMQRTAVVERTLLHFVPKYERYEKRRRRYLAHSPSCLNVPLGHRVRMAETRPLSKTVSFCIVEDLGEAARDVAGEEARPADARPRRGRYGPGGLLAMKGLAVLRSRGLPKGARLDCVDNSGAKVVEIIAVRNWHGTHRRYPRAAIADLIIVSVKKGTPEMRRQVLHAVIVRSRSAIHRADGTRLMFEDNAAVITTETGEIKGSQIKGPVAKEAAERWPRIAAASSIIV